MRFENQLKRIDAFDARLRAFAVVDRAPAPAAPGPLASQTLAVKDNLDVAGLQTGGGSVVPLDPAPRCDAAAVQRLRAAGMVVIGKTQMAELAFGGWGTNAATGCPLNPWASAPHVAGGSSSGSAVAVAAGLADAALGTDTGGSVRIPAALCGLTGLRPRQSMVARVGLHALSPSLDSIGPIAWMVAEVARMFEAMADNFDALAALDAPFSPMRLAAPHAEALGALHSAVAAAFDAALRIVAPVTRVALPRPLDSFIEPLGALLGHEAWRLHGARVAAHGERMDPWVVARLRAGARVGKAAYRAALAAREPSRRDFVDALGDFDLLLTPTTPIPAIPIEQVDESSLPLSRFTRAFSYLDLPALTVPCGFTPEGLPIGLQIVALDGREDSAIALGAAFQRRTDWHARRPALSLDQPR